MHDAKKKILSVIAAGVLVCTLVFLAGRHILPPDKDPAKLTEYIGRNAEALIALARQYPDQYRSVSV